MAGKMTADQEFAVYDQKYRKEVHPLHAHLQL
jgi:hypothetical protein